MSILRFNKTQLTDGVIYSRSQISDIAYSSKVSDEEKCAVLYQLGSIYSDRIVTKKVDDEYLKDLIIKTDIYGDEFIEVNLKLINYMHLHKIVKYTSKSTATFNTEYLRKMLIGDCLFNISDITEHLNFCLILNEIDKSTDVDNWLVKALLTNVKMVAVVNVGGIDKLTDKIIIAIRNSKYKKYLKLTEKHPDKIYNNLKYINLAFKAESRLIFQDLVMHYTKSDVVSDFRTKYPDTYEELIAYIKKHYSE